MAEKPEGWGGLIRALLALGDEDQAAEVLAQVPAKIAEHAEIAGARARWRWRQEGRKAQAAMAGLAARWPPTRMITRPATSWPRR